MILFALTSDIKQSTDYADLDSLLYGISNGDKKCLEQPVSGYAHICLQFCPFGFEKPPRCRGCSP